jgi:hypothetical protein
MKGQMGKKVEIENILNIISFSHNTNAHMHTIMVCYVDNLFKIIVIIMIIQCLEEIYVTTIWVYAKPYTCPTLVQTLPKFVEQVYYKI